MKDIKKIFEKLLYHRREYATFDEKLRNWCFKKYGFDWSERNMDDIIDALDYGGGMTFEKFIKRMNEELLEGRGKEKEEWRLGCD